jgi:transposase
MIVKVRSGQMTATDAAQALGVSRKSYYQWEKRGLSAMLSQLEDQKPGRPSSRPSPELVRMRSELSELRTRAESLEQTVRIRGLLRHMEGSAAKKKQPRSSNS